MVITNVQRISIPSFSQGLAYWGGGQGKFMVWRSSSPVSPWCSIAYASWTEWWRHRVSAGGPGGNLLQRPAVSHWGVRSLPGSSRQQDTENQTKDNFIKDFHIRQSEHVYSLYHKTLNTDNGHCDHIIHSLNLSIREVELELCCRVLDPYSCLQMGAGLGIQRNSPLHFIILDKTLREGLIYSLGPTGRWRWMKSGAVV